jgi:membrane fusion protein (multidrug efflux system)
MPPTPVEVATIERGNLIDQFVAVGSFEAVQSIQVVSEVSGIVRELPFREGEPVAKGTLIARLEDSELAASLARAEATLEQAQNSYERVRSVVEQKAAAPQDLDDALATLRVAEAEAALARARLDKTRIRAAFAGHLGPRLVSDGSYLQAGQTITELTQLDELEVVFNAPERFLPRMNVDAEVTVSTPAYPGVSVDGHIYVVDPVVDPTTRTIEIIARVPNPGLRFRPGMSADIVAVLGQKSDALLVPSAAVFAEGNETLVYVVGPDSTVVRTPVVLGARLAASVEVVDGIEAGAQVVRAGHQKLFPGAKVLPIPAADSAERNDR